MMKHNQPRKSLPASLTGALTCPDGDQIKRLAECLKLEMERVHRCNFRFHIDHGACFVLVRID